MKQSKRNRKSVEKGLISEGPQNTRGPLNGMTQAFLEWALSIAASVTQGTVEVVQRGQIIEFTVIVGVLVEVVEVRGAVAV